MWRIPEHGEASFRIFETWSAILSRAGGQPPSRRYPEANYCPRVTVPPSAWIFMFWLIVRGGG